MPPGYVAGRFVVANFDPQRCVSLRAAGKSTCMPTRRAVISVPVLAAAGAVPVRTVPKADPVGMASTRCPPSTAGSVTGQSGFLTPLVDAYTFTTGMPFQGELATILTDVTAGCDRFRSNERVRGETWIRLIQLKGWLNQPENFTPLDWIAGQFGVGGLSTEPDGSIRQARAYHTVFGNGCNYKDQLAVAGSVTWDVIDIVAGQISGSFDLVFPDGKVAASFTAPICSLADCPPRPSTATCIDQ